MEPSAMPLSSEIRDIAERLLTRAFRGPVRLGEERDLGGSKRSKVYRCAVLDGPGGIPGSVIVKHAHATAHEGYDPDRPGLIAYTLLNEWASLQFLSQLTDPATGQPFAPRFYGGDRAAGVVVMEDLQDLSRLDHFLLAADPVASEAALIEFAAVHGRLHAVTEGRQAEYARIREPLGTLMTGTDYDNYDWLAASLYAATTTLGIVPERGVDAELAALRKAIENPGPFLTFTQGDSCPDNCLYANSAARLIDFEGGAFDHALKEGVYGRVPFPTCWCVYRLPEQIPLRMEAAYRAELIKGCPEAADDTLFYRAVVEACVYWMIGLYHDIPISTLLERDIMVVVSTIRQRLLLRSALLVRLTEEYGYFEAIGATVRAIAAELRKRWPEVEALAYYPAFAREDSPW